MNATFENEHPLLISGSLLLLNIYNHIFSTNLIYHFYVYYKGTTTEVFATFIEHICSSIETNPVVGYDTDSFRVFLWDNLNSHLSHLVTQTVEGRSGNTIFSIILRPPYQPKYGPIEYIICDLVGELVIDAEKEWNTNILEKQILDEFLHFRWFNNTFYHYCGYSGYGFY